MSEIVLQAKGLKLQRGARTLLDGVSLELAAGDFLAVLGPNGAGKSSLLRALTGEWPLSSGQVTVHGSELSSWSRERLAQRMAVMTQQAHLAFDFRVREVLALGRLPHKGAGMVADRAVVDAVIEALSLQGLADRPYPALSGGERQRVQFGRALVQLWATQEPALLLLDEPSSALDLAQQQLVFRQLQACRRQRMGVLAVLHDLRLALRHSSHVLLLREGRVLAAGPTQLVLTVEHVAEAYGIDAGEAVHALGGASELKERELEA